MSKKRKFTVTVTRIDEFDIELDEEKIPKELINSFEKNIFNLKSDKMKNLAEYIGRLSPDNMSQFYEGLGYICTDGLTLSNEYVPGINITTNYIEDIELDIDEIKGGTK